jgi:hypothetical protein
MPKINIDLGNQLKFANEYYVVLKMVKNLPEPEKEPEKESEPEIPKESEKAIKKKQWAQTCKICKECLGLVKNGNMWRHVKTQKHLYISEMNKKLYKPTQLRVKIIELEKLYNLK